ncbi:MAG TPA: hypothetical protein PLS24_01545, partial [Sedimentisphaerales bacterium]|nr:hypothetical protein [Sedimentisphaerales bacterium]
RMIGRGIRSARASRLRRAGAAGVVWRLTWAGATTDWPRLRRCCRSRAIGERFSASRRARM